MGWPFVGRERESRSFQSALCSGQAGVVLAGGAGVGKTRLAVELVRSLDAGEPVAVFASDSSSRIPLGAFASHLKAVHQPYETEAALFAAASNELATIKAPLLVDDAHHLDEMSASLLHQSLLHGGTNLVATIRTGEDPPGAVTKLWKDDLLGRIDVEPLNERTVRRLVRLVLDGDVDDSLMDELWRVSQGNVLYLRHLLEGAIDDGTITRLKGRWTLDGVLSPSPRLVDLLAAEIHKSGTSRVLQYVAAADPIEFDLLVQLVGTPPVDAGEQHGMIRVERSDRRVSVTAAHPLFPEVALSLATEVEKRDVRSTAAQSIESRGMKRESDLLRVARLYLDAGGKIPLDTAVAAARVSLRLFDAQLADQLLDAARRDADSHEARILHARALRFLNRPTDATSILEEDMRLSEDDPDVADAATLAIDTLLFSGRATEAGELAQQILVNLEHPVSRARVATEASLVSVVRGDLWSAVDFGEPVLYTAGIPDLVRLNVLVVVTAAQPLTGRLHEVHARTDNALELAQLDGSPPLAIHQLTMNRFFAHQCEGRIDLAAEVGRNHWERVSEAGGPIACVGMILGDALFELSEFGEMIAVYEAALDAIERFDPFANRSHIHLWAATLAYQIGMNELGRIWEIQAADEATDIRWIVRRHRIDAWQALLREDMDSARYHYDQSADVAEKSGYRMWLVYALADAIRLGTPDLVIGHIDRLADVIDGETVQLFSRHAHALADGSGNALDAMSDRYRELGWTLRSAEAAADAARAHLRSGDDPSSRRASVRAKLIFEDFTHLTPPLREIPEGLTARELEVARLTASGLSNQELANRLYVSVRTIENHLSRIYRKLGITDRRDLAEFINN